MVRRMKDEILRRVSLIVAVVGAVLALAGFLSLAVRPLVEPSASLVAGVAAVLFVRMLCSRDYRRGIDAANLAMQGAEAWPGQWKFFDPDWGLLGKRVGTPALIWVRAALYLGVLPIFLLQHWTGVKAGWLWFACTFVAIQLSIMHAAITAQTPES